MASDNKLLGNFDLTGIPPAPRGVPQIEVSFDIDANGIVNVAARDKGTGTEQNITVQSSGGLSDSDIERMVREAEDNAEADKIRKEKIENRNEADGLIYNTEKSLTEHKDKISEEIRQGIEDTIKDTRALLAKDDFEVDELKEKIVELSSAAQKIGEAVYKASQESQSAKSEEPADGGRTVDAEEEKRN